MKERMDILESSAIDAFLTSDWEKALKLNKKILQNDPNDIQALNRFSFVCLKLGQKEKAKKGFSLVLKLDPLNSVAKRNLEFIKSNPTNLKGEAIIHGGTDAFLEEPGKTMTVKLVRLAPWSNLCQVQVGENLSLSSKRRLVAITRMKTIYLGSLPEDLSARLLVLIKAGNEYGVLAKSVSKNSLVIFLRELVRCPEFSHIPSFPELGKKNFYSTITV